MRSMLVLAALALAMPRDADACLQPTYEEHVLDRSQLSDTMKPGPVSISMWIEQPDGGGCATRESRCAEPAGRRLVVMVSASDDQTPPDKMGYRVDITSGRAPFPAPGDVRAIDGLLRFDLGDSEDYEFELAIRAVDLNGNMGPPTYTPIAEASGEGCASHHGRAVSFGMLAIVIALVVGRRRRP